MSTPACVVIINPRSGTANGGEAGRRRAARAAAFLAARGVDPQGVFLTERAGHARELAATAVARGAATVIAWGGDGTINEVASALVFTNTALGIVPGGSGNGLSRELRIPFRPEAALDLALSGPERIIDAGEIEGRYFFNVAGVGLDARVAHRFAAEAAKGRGFLRYAEVTIREFWGIDPEEVTVKAGGTVQTTRPLIVAIANGRQYGNRATIAPGARFDDGWLDVVVFEQRSALRACLALPFIFTGRISSLAGVRSVLAESVELSARGLMSYHLDGEPLTGGATLRARVRPGALRVKARTVL